MTDSSEVELQPRAAAARHGPQTELSLVELNMPNIRAARLRPAEARDIADRVYETLMRADLRQHRTGAELSTDAGNCWLISTVYTSCELPDGTVVTCRNDTYQCEDGRQYVVTIPLT